MQFYKIINNFSNINKLKKYNISDKTDEQNICQLNNSILKMKLDFIFKVIFYSCLIQKKIILKFIKYYWIFILLNIF